MKVSEGTGHPISFIIACLSIVVWAVFGPIFAYSDAYQLVINTGTTIVTFLMLFLLQNSGNRNSEQLLSEIADLKEMIERLDRDR